MTILMDIVDQALQVVDGHRDSIDQPSDFHVMPEETIVVALELSSTKSTAKKYSCNKEGDFFDKFDNNKSR
jgi:hypothetical protein